MDGQQQITIRPMGAADVTDADALAWASLSPLWPQELQPEDGPVRRDRGQRRIAHLLATDPGGAWVAEDPTGSLVGVANALVRDGLWLLSLLAVAPGQQGRGVGVRLLECALSAAGSDGARLVMSSHDPRALRAYHRAGLDAHPTMEAAGAINRSRIPKGLRSSAGDHNRDGERIDAIGNLVRGAGYGSDIAAAIDTGCTLWVHGDDGFALERDGAPYLVAARSAEAAADLTWTCLSQAEAGSHAYIAGITAGNDWALTVGLDAGFSLASDGALFSSNVHGTMAPFLPSGAYL